MGIFRKKHNPLSSDEGASAIKQSSILPLPQLFWRKLHIFFLNNNIVIITALIVFVLMILSYWGAVAMESYARTQMLAMIPIQILIGMIHAVIFILGYTYFMPRAFGRMTKKKVKGELVNIRFSDVIGVDEAKEEAMEVVNLIRDHKRVKEIGGKIIKGLLMVGPPGCGKTLLAKAIATEAGIPFISMAGSEFVEVFVGVGASRVRQAFKKARSLAYANGACIVFIDELDVIGRSRSFSIFGGQESNSTQNQLLVEMDGLSHRKENIIVIGATNAAIDVLDKALLRPGRFDRKIYIDRPYVDGREKLFRFYLSKVKHDPKIDIRRLANYTVGSSAADIENIVKEASLIATRSTRDAVVTFADLSAALERISLGIVRKRRITDKEKEATAYHEAGHAIAVYYLHPMHDVFKLSIATREQTLGVCHHQPLEEMVTTDRNEYLATIQVAIGGYIAEKLKFNVTYDGVSSDFKHAMTIANAMVWRLGMGAEGVVGDYLFAGYEHLDHLSSDVKQRLNHEVEEIIKFCYRTVENLLKDEVVLLDTLAKRLIEKTELEYMEIDQICQEYGKRKERAIEKDGLLARFRTMEGIEQRIHETPDTPQVDGAV